MKSSRVSAVLTLYLLSIIAVIACLPLGVLAAEDPPRPPVQLAASPPPGCDKLGEVDGRHANESPREEEAQAEAFRDARKLGATHFVTESAIRCGGNAYCYTGIAYRCPGKAAPAPAK